MSERWWIALAGEGERREVERVVHGLEPDARVVFARDAHALRQTLTDGTPGSLAVAVGPGSDGVSAINLAAAVVRDGHARQVVLMGRGISGSMRSRARRAGVETLIDLDGRKEAGDASPLRVVSGEGPTARVTSDGNTSTSTCGEGLVPKEAARAEKGESATSREGEASGVAPVLVVGSGRGGVGKTTIAALSALVAASWGLRTALVDLDLGTGNLYTLFGLARPPALDGGRWREGDMAGVDRTAAGERGEGAEGRTLRDAGVTVSENVVLWGPCARPEMAEKVTPLVGPFLDDVAREYDLVIVDASTTCTEAVAWALRRCDRLMLVHEEEPPAIGSLSRAAALAVRLGVARTQIVRVANRGDQRVRFDLAAGRAELGLETARAFRLLEGGAEATELLAAGKVAELAAADVEPTASIAQALARILDELGCLPDAEGARAALEQTQGRGRRFRFWMGRAAV